MEVERWKSQLWKGAAELAILALLERRESYGLQLLEAVRGREGLGLSEGTIYPLLNRLQKEGKISALWVEDPGASHPRKYYRLTVDGSALLQGMKAEWGAFRRSLTDLIEGDRA
ncbi:MAG: PadR family transcriptional regulator [Candidatus Krumholzibacteriia bacterium]